MGKKKSKGNGEGTIYVSSKTGLYVGQYVVDGKRKSVYQKKNEKAGDFKARFYKIIMSITDGTYISKSSETLETIIERHIEQKNKDGITSTNSYKRDKETLEQIKKCCSNFINKPIQKVTLYDIEKSKEKMKQYKKSGIDRAWRLLFKGFRIASSPSNRLIPYNIMDDENLKKPVSEKITEKVKPLTVAEEKRLNEILDNEERNHPYRNIVKLELITAMRIGEALARSINNIDKENKKLLINNTLTEDADGTVILGEHTKTYNKTTGIDEGIRNFPISEEIDEIISEQTKDNITNIYGLLFWDYEKNTFISPKEINAWLRRLNAKYKISKTLHNHKLRHTRITRWKEAGMDLNAIQYLAGHVEGSEITNKVYIDVSENFAFEQLEKAL
jgi:integrase